MLLYIAKIKMLTTGICVESKKKFSKNVLNHSFDFKGLEHI